MTTIVLPAPARATRTPALFLPGEAILCPHLHQLPDTVVELPHGLRQCRAKVQHQRYGRACGVWLWVFQHGDGTRTVVSVSDAEAQHIAKACLTIAAIRDFLRLRWVS